MKKLGLYCGARNVQGVKDFENWLGQPLSHALDFTSGGDKDHTVTENWAMIEDPVWWLDGWKGQPQQVTFSIPMLPPTGATLQAGARGEYNAHWTQLATHFLAEGFGNAVLRPGWEFNGRWYPWFAGNDPGAFAEYWRQIVTTMRAVSKPLRFEWCPTLGKGNMTNVEAAWPGKAYVNRIGTDVYDSGPESTIKARLDTYLNQPYGLGWHANWAMAQHKNMSYAEWGLWNRDEPAFIEMMYDWIDHNPVVSANYFDVQASAEHRLEKFPNAQRRFRELFG